MNISIKTACLATILSMVVIFLLRAFPFILFSKREPPAILQFIEKYIPPMIMAILLFYCLKDVKFSSAPYGIPYFTALTATVLLHLWKNNSLLSIFGGTALFMILNSI
jgi:branched-subunit amino acid transport protein AzlD